MTAIGQRALLRVVREAPPGLYLDGEELGEILLPRRYIPAGTVAGDELDVFVHRDSEDRLVATTEKPEAVVGEFACMRVVDTHPGMGAFLDWGLSKDLLLPNREQSRKVQAGERVIAGVILDTSTGRIIASTRLNALLDRIPPSYEKGQRVSLLIAAATPLGYKAIVENAHWGMLYKTDLSGQLDAGQRLEGYIREIRPDGKIDLALDRAGYRRVVPLAIQILEAVKENGGRLDFDDDSPPEAIRATFGTSKKAFKQALGALLRGRRIRFDHPGISLVEDGSGRPAKEH